jgi:hypothetical protein
MISLSLLLIHVMEVGHAAQQIQAISRPGADCSTFAVAARATWRMERLGVFDLS